MATERYDFTTELIIDVIVFYIGLVLFIGLCLIPPVTFMLPYILPIVFIVCIIANISFIVRLTKNVTSEVTETTENINI